MTTKTYPRFTKRGRFLFIRQPDTLTVNALRQHGRAHSLLCWVHYRFTIPITYRVGCLESLPPSPFTLDAVRHYVRNHMRRYREGISHRSETEGSLAHHDRLGELRAGGAGGSDNPAD